MNATERASIANPSDPIATGSGASDTAPFVMPADANRPQRDFASTFDWVVRRYRDGGRFARGYVAAKLHHDPAYRRVLALAASEAFGDVVDIGCGRGQLAVALLEAGLARSVLGLDRNAAHLDLACRA